MPAKILIFGRRDEEPSRADLYRQYNVLHKDSPAQSYWTPAGGWPRHTWFQRRLAMVRSRNRRRND